MIPLWIVLSQAKLSVWEQDLTVNQLAVKLSNSSVRYSADPAISGRHVAVFAKNRSANEIAKMVANCLGLKLSGTKFVPDPIYEKLINGYEDELRQSSITALREAVRKLRATPPKRVPGADINHYRGVWSFPGDKNRSYPQPGDSLTVLRKKQIDLTISRFYQRPEVALLLSKCSDSDLESLINGSFIIGSVPHRKNTIRLPGSTKDYRHFTKSDQGFVVLQLDTKTQQLFHVTYTPKQELPNSQSDHISLAHNGLFGRLSEATDLGSRTRNWGDPNSMVLYEAFQSAKIPHGKFGDSELLSILASSMKRPVIAEKMPWEDNSGRRLLDRSTKIVRESDQWVLVKPSSFWQADKIWSLGQNLKLFERPNVENPIAALDWASKVAIFLSGNLEQYLYFNNTAVLNRAALGYRPCLARFWKSLLLAEKQLLLKGGLARKNLSIPTRDKFDAAAMESIFHSGPKGDISPFLQRSNDLFVSLVARKSWTMMTSKSGSMSGPSRNDLLNQAVRLQIRNPDIVGGQHFVFRFTCESGFIEESGSVYQRITK